MPSAFITNDCVRTYFLYHVHFHVEWPVPLPISAQCEEAQLLVDLPAHASSIILLNIMAIPCQC